MMGNIWLQSALWMALALLAAIGSMLITISAALFEIIIGAIAGNTIGLPLAPWIDYIASFGAIVLTFLAGTDIDPRRRQEEFLVERHHRADGVLRALPWLPPAGKVRPRLALAASADRRHCALDHVCRGGLCGHGRDRLQPH